MKSLIQEAIKKANEEAAGTARPALATPAVSGASPFASLFLRETPAPAPTPQAVSVVVDEPKSDIDRELEALIQGLSTKIKVVGCGGGGCNTIARLSQTALEKVELVACNTDAQHLLSLKIQNKILIGRNLTRGLGAGAIPQIGENAAHESEDKIRQALEGADMVFVTAGMGGGTGTGSAPVVAQIAREMGALTIAVVTSPFSMEGAVRAKNAEAGLARLRDASDTTVVIPNDKLLEVAPRLPLAQAFRVADEILVRSIRSLTEMITKPGLVNLDFADLKTVMAKGGVAMIGLGEAEGDQRAHEAVEEALNSPLLDVDVSTATACLVDVAGGPSMTLQEAQQVVQEIHDRVAPDCRIIWGANVLAELGSTIRVMVVLTGVRSKQLLGRDDGSEKTAVNRAAKQAGLDFVL